MKQLLKISLLFLILHFAFLIGNGQNLVPNPSFENTISFGWTQINTADYFSTNYNSVPNNSDGYQFPASGNAYAGFSSYVNGSVAPNLREIIGTPLTTPLIVGQKLY